MKRTFKREFLTEELDLPFRADERTVVDTSGRWTDVVEIVFHLDDQDDGTYWLTTYEQGSTENQETRPWEYEDEVECTLVRKLPVVVEKWVEVDE